MSKLIKIAVVTAATFAGAVSAQADSISQVEGARIAEKAGTVTAGQKVLLDRYGH